MTIAIFRDSLILKAVALSIPFLLLLIYFAVLHPKIFVAVLIVLLPLSINLENTPFGFGISLPAEVLVTLMAFLVLVNLVKGKDVDWLKGGRIDLLALKQKENSIYEFEVFEVKIGNNPDLKGAVAQQLKDYQEYILRNFKDFKFCYEKHYEQKKYLGLFSIPDYDRIKIEQPVSGRVIIGGYNEIAKKYIDNLEEQGIIVQTFNY